MCDCYTAQCESCARAVEVHIADFCTARSNVHVYCSHCLNKIPAGRANMAKKMIKCTVENRRQVEGGKIGQEVVFLVDDEDSYGIHLN